MIYYLTGNNEYKLKNELLRIKRAFLEKFSENSFFELDSENFSAEKLENILSLGSLFDSKKLIFISGYKKNDTLKLCQLLSKKEESTIVYLFEENSNKEIEKIANVTKKFLINKSSLPINEVIEFSKRENIKIEFKVANEIAMYSGGDLRFLESEIKKLACFARGNNQSEIKLEDVRSLLRPKTEANVFLFFDALAQKNEEKVRKLYKNILKANQLKVIIIGALASQFRKLIVAKFLLEQGRSRIDVQKALGSSGFAVDKVILQAKNFTRSELITCYFDLLKMDFNDKSGKEFSEISLDLLINKICAKKSIEKEEDFLYNNKSTKNC